MSCGYFIICCSYITSLCLVVTSLCLVVTSLCLVVTSLYAFVPFSCITAFYRTISFPSHYFFRNPTAQCSNLITNNKNYKNSLIHKSPLSSTSAALFQILSTLTRRKTLIKTTCTEKWCCRAVNIKEILRSFRERFEPRSHFKVG